MVLTTGPVDRVATFVDMHAHPGHAPRDPEDVGDPAACAPPRRQPEGVPCVVAGDPLIADGGHTGALPGRPLVRAPEGDPR